MTTPTDTEIALAFKAGWGVSAIAQHYGVANDFIEKAIRRYLFEAEKNEQN